MTRRGFFVSGTDTGVGKTVASCAIVRALRGAGIDVAAMKPIETGVGPGGPLDAAALQSAADGIDELEDICPQRFALPAAPNVAAAHEGRSVDLDLIREAFQRLASRHAAVVVEGAGGLLVPIADDSTMADLVARLNLPLILVVRAALGTINHTLLTLEAAGRRGLDVAGVIASHTDGELCSADAANFEFLRRELGQALIGEIPPLAPGHEPEPGWLRLDPLLTYLS